MASPVERPNQYENELIRLTNRVCECPDCLDDWNEVVGVSCDESPTDPASTSVRDDKFLSATR